MSKTRKQEATLPMTWVLSESTGLPPKAYDMRLEEALFRMKYDLPSEKNTKSIESKNTK